jgi:hypothetical protein
VVGAVTGVVSFYRTEEIDVRLEPRHSALPNERVLDVGIVNSSQGAVSIVGGTLRFDGYPVVRSRVLSLVRSALIRAARRAAGRSL